uniref:Endonuclease/exonuclease/phosphatase domain-containing protein n=1 Tax=Chromera velia CCMP2878 TaxID=1169474 RepID=A0A0K6SAG8_9ALVE|eukprot:Cvel_10250.t2-p1 / transcript=Cvel_10250.t2 / gene=Cvel_10250 / organism=Chromera_velia_CCMP2878 / gene_product=hypothetical protein / transcript_product=hypothetical protein / location=Cvel_scaffold614:37601-38695(+) / protein_length=365 / sequence_SO=supercontig / SO=protein_coding / is_pseudo=false
MIRCHLFYVIAICSLAFQCLAKDLKVATVNTLSQSKCAATPGGIPSMTAEDALAKKTWLTDTLLTAKVKNANLDIVTLQEIDVGESSGKESGKSSHADVKKWAEDNGYTFASSIPSPDYKPDPGSKEDGVVLLLKTATFENPHVCTKLRTGTSKEDRVVVCDGLKVNGAGTLNVFAAHAPSSTFPTEEADPTVWAKLKNAHLILGDMNEESKSFKARIDAKNTKKGYTSEVYPPAGSDTPPNGCVSPAKTGESYEWPLSTTRKDVYKYRKLAQAAENTVSFQNLAEEQKTCAALKCKPGDTDCCELDPTQKPKTYKEDGVSSLSSPQPILSILCPRFAFSRLSFLPYLYSYLAFMCAHPVIRLDV